MKLKYIIYIMLIGFLYSCQPELDDYSISSGNADFTTYVSLGNSLTAGYADGSLYRSGQMNSFPSILARQFQKAGSGNFVQPLMEGEYGILPGKRVLGYSTDCLGATSLAPVPANGTPEAIAPVGYAVNNLGVPGAKSFHLIAPGYGDLAGVPAGLANPYYARFASSSVSTVVGDAINMNPTFYSLWIGNNDVLGYATSGGTGDSITGQNTFAYALNTILTAMNGTGAKGVIANIPDVTTIPFFTTVPYNSLVLSDQQQVDGLNAAYAQLGITFNLGPNGLIIADANAPGGLRQIKSTELVLLTVPQDSIKCAGWGSQIPIPDQYILTEYEINNIEAAVTGFNATISQLASQFGLAHVDMNARMNDLKDGLIYNGETFTSTFVTGNGFSLDGVHLTPKGYALVANYFIEAINQQFGSTLPIVSTLDYPAVELP